MSYDLTAYRLPSGLAPANAYEALVAAEEEDRPLALEIPMVLREELAALLEREVGLERFGPDEENARGEEAVAAEYAGDESIELNGPEVTGLQVSLYSSSASISIPYWHKGADAHRVFEQISRCAAILRERGGLIVFDNQTGRPIQTDADLEAARAEYAGVAGNLKEVLNARGGSTGSRKPWWKFW